MTSTSAPMTPYEPNPDLATPLGRELEIDALRGLLDRPTPAHVSIVGPKSIGKTLLLRALAERAAGWPRFSAVAPWDVRRHTPKDDDTFFAGLAAALSESLEEERPDLAEYLREDPTVDMIQDVFGEFERRDERVLLIVDHLDRALRQPGISKELWDNLRDLTVRGALVLVTATRERLRELTTADSRTSEFWNVFAPPLTLGPFSDADLETFLTPLQEARGPLAPPASKEFERQTGGVPLLCTLLARDLCATPHPTDGQEAARPGGQVEKAQVTHAAEALSQSSDHVASLWDDLPSPAQALLVEIAVRGEEGVPTADAPRDRREAVVARGYARESSAHRLLPAARIMLDHAALHEASTTDLARLFGPDADARSNMRALLQLQVESVEGGPAELRSDINRAVRDLNAKPVRALGALREFAHAALDVVWAADFPDRLIPDTVVAAWYRSDDKWVSKQATPLYEATKGPIGQIPYSRSKQESLLSILTNPAHQGETSVSDGTYRLIAALRELGNYAHHVEDAGVEEVPFETAAAGCALGAELFRRLVAELPLSAR